MRWRLDFRLIPGRQFFHREQGQWMRCLEVRCDEAVLVDADGVLWTVPEPLVLPNRVILAGTGNAGRNAVRSW